MLRSLNPFAAALWVGAVLAAGLSVASAEDAQADLKARFGKAYYGAQTDARVQALDMLKGSTDKTIWALAQKIACSDPDKRVRVAAYDVLCSYDSPDGCVTDLVVNAFTAEQDPENKIRMAQALPKLPYKVRPVHALCCHIATLKCPDAVDERIAQDKQELERVRARLRTSRDPKERQDLDAARGNLEARIRRMEQERPEIERQRQVAESYLTVLNGITEMKFPTSRKTTGEIAAWWERWQGEYLDKDRKVLAQRTGAGKSNLPNPPKPEPAK